MKNLYLKIQGFALIISIITLSIFMSNSAAAQSDIYSPEVIASYPSNGAQNIPQTVRVSVSFNEPMDPGSVTTDTFTVFEDMGDQVMGTVSYANRTITFTPFTTFSSMTTYSVTVSESVRDSMGNTLGDDYEFSFQTAFN